MDLSMLLAQGRDMLMEEKFFDQLTSQDSVSAISETSNVSQWLLWVVVGIVLVGVVIVPRILNRMLNLGSVLSIAAMALTAVGLPYALQLANSQTVIETSAATGVEPKEVRVVSVSPTILRVEWITVESVLGTVRYGNGPESMNLAVFSSNPPRKQTEHKAVIEGLEAGRTYYLTIVSGGDTFGNQGVPIEVMMPVSF